MTSLNSTAPRPSPAPRWRPGAAVLLLALALAALLLPALVHAHEYSSSRKFGRGLAGMTVGFLEIPGNVIQESRSNGVLSGMTLGLAKGLGKCVTRELVGVYEFLTAPFAVPSGFKPVLEPEFPWQYFEVEDAGHAGIEGDLRGIPGTTVSQRDGDVAVTSSDELLFSTASARLAPE